MRLAMNVQSRNGACALLLGCAAGCSLLYSADNISSVAPAVDGGMSPADASLGFCASQKTSHQLCEDFDEGAYDAQFNSVDATPNGALSADSTYWVSSPNSLLSTLAQPSTTGDHAFMERLFPGTASTVTYTFDLRLDSWFTTISGDAAVVASITINDYSPNMHSLALLLGSDWANLQEGFNWPDGSRANLDHFCSSSPAVGSWTTVTLILDLVGGTCSAALNGIPVLTRSTINSSWTTGAPSVQIGIGYVVSASLPLAARYDNVVVDWQ
jgi:hypothetical protein